LPLRKHSPAALNAVLLGLPAAEAESLARSARALARTRRLIYMDDGRDGPVERLIELKLRPRPMTADRARFFQHIAKRVRAAQAVIAAEWAVNERLREAMPMTPPEVAFHLDLRRRGGARAYAAPIVSRLDASADLYGADWRETLRLFEVNSVGIGGIDLISTGDRVVRDTVVRKLGLKLRPFPDLRAKLLALLVSTARARGAGARPVIALIEDRSSLIGTLEYDAFQVFFRTAGARCVLADPREMEPGKGGRAVVRGEVCDVVYRDLETQDLLDLKGKGADGAQAAFREAFLHGRVVSGPAGDFDHKSLFEVLTDPAWARLFSRADRDLFARHVLWTRLVRERRTPGPEGREVDLVPFIRKNRARLVMKPNRLFGGKGVVCGPDVTQSEWEKTLEGALKTRDHVVQRLGEMKREPFPILDGAGPAGTLAECYVDCGFFLCGPAFGVLSRACPRRVVNVSSGGGICAVLQEQS
jgi:hypothetical protein